MITCIKRGVVFTMMFLATDQGMAQAWNYDVVLDPDTAYRKAIPMQFTPLISATLSLSPRPNSGYSIRDSQITVGDTILWKRTQATEGAHKYSLTDAYSSQEHVVISGNLFKPGKGGGGGPTPQDPWFRVTVSAVNIDWEAHQNDEANEDARLVYCPVTLNPNARTRAVIQTVRDDFSSQFYGTPSSDPMVTLTWSMPSNIEIAWENGTKITSGAAFQLPYNIPKKIVVNPLVAYTEFQITLSGLSDNSGSAATDRIKGMSAGLSITPPELLGCPRCLGNTVFSLLGKEYAHGNITWTISPTLPNGATITVFGDYAFFQPGTVGMEYTITATSSAIPSCFGTAKVTVCVPGPITQTGNTYVIKPLVGCLKQIVHAFTPTPLTTASANHFCFVQYMRGSWKKSDGTFWGVYLYGNPNLIDINFPTDVIDSKIDDPVYGSSENGRPGHLTDDNIVYYVPDNPSPVYDVNEQCDLHFITGVYCIKGVPTTGASSMPSIGIPFDSKTWDYKIFVIRDESGKKVYTH